MFVPYKCHELPGLSFPLLLAGGVSEWPVPALALPSLNPPGMPHADVGDQCLGGTLPPPRRQWDPPAHPQPLIYGGMAMGGTHLPRQLVGLLGDDSLGGGYPQKPCSYFTHHNPPCPPPPRLPQPRAGPPRPEHPGCRGTSPGWGEAAPGRVWGTRASLGGDDSPGAPPPGGRVGVRGGHERTQARGQVG